MNFNACIRANTFFSAKQFFRIKYKHFNTHYPCFVFDTHVYIFNFIIYPSHAENACSFSLSLGRKSFIVFKVMKKEKHYILKICGRKYDLRLSQVHLAFISQYPRAGSQEGWSQGSCELNISFS